MVKATWNGVLLAESDETIMIEGNHYFPPDSVNMEYFEKTETHTTCFWKGLAYYYNIVVNGETNKDAAWYYPEPKEGSPERVGKDFSNYVAFWRDVEIEE
ncbi:DUF427 domain-containing protein [Methanolobus sp. ZRKC3]|uniref:DUF427 domain-containing protein n=1 Tax=Methanolobus sp. ZRKC3 TaxID=3125786 RepID=UPI0032446B94